MAMPRVRSPIRFDTGVWLGHHPGSVVTRFALFRRTLTGRVLCRSCRLRIQTALWSVERSRRVVRPFQIGSVARNRLGHHPLRLNRDRFVRRRILRFNSGIPNKSIGVPADIQRASCRW